MSDRFAVSRSSLVFGAVVSVALLTLEAAFVWGAIAHPQILADASIGEKASPAIVLVVCLLVGSSLFSRIELSGGDLRFRILYRWGRIKVQSILSITKLGGPISAYVVRVSSESGKTSTRYVPCVQQEGQFVSDLRKMNSDIVLDMSLTAQMRNFENRE